MKQGQQTINCTVNSCQHYQNNYCSLKSIQVAPCSNVQSGLSEEESMCASYAPRG